MISPEEAWRRIEPWATTRGVLRVDRRASAGRVLAAPLAATGDLPSADLSALDGFALSGEVAVGDVLECGATLAAGAAPGARLRPGTALRIWTGAPVPEGADRVVAIEDCETPSTDSVRILSPPPAGNAVRRRGEVARENQELLASGAWISAAALALAASQGLDEIEVFRPPTVALLATGDEIVAPDRLPSPAGARDSHTDFLLASGRQLGLEFESLGVAPDNQEELASRLAPAIQHNDLVLVCGGVSMGGADHAPRVFEHLGVQRIFHGVAVQPGKPLWFGRSDRTLVFGLPGNPASVMVAFRLFVRPALERILGRDARFWSDARSIELVTALGAGRGRDRFVPAVVEGEGSAARARPLPVAGSHDLVAFARAELLLRVRAGDPARPAGADVEAITFS